MYICVGGYLYILPFHCDLNLTPPVVIVFHSSLSLTARGLQCPKLGMLWLRGQGAREVWECPNERRMQSPCEVKASNRGRGENHRSASCFRVTRPHRSEKRVPCLNPLWPRPRTTINPHHTVLPFVIVVAYFSICFSRFSEHRIELCLPSPGDRPDLRSFLFPILVRLISFGVKQHLCSIDNKPGPRSFAAIKRLK